MACYKRVKAKNLQVFFKGLFGIAQSAPGQPLSRPTESTEMSHEESPTAKLLEFLQLLYITNGADRDGIHPGIILLLLDLIAAAVAGPFKVSLEESKPPENSSESVFIPL